MQGRAIILIAVMAIALFSRSRQFHPLDSALQFARKVGIAESVIDKANGEAKPALRLQHTHDRSFSWIGGRPMLPPDFVWPQWQGRPLNFVAQLDLSEVAAAIRQPWLPKSGQLYFFYAADQSVGGYDLSDRGAWRVIYSAAERAALLAAAAPASLEGALFPESNVAFRKIASIPSDERLMGNWDVTNDEFEALLSAQNAPFQNQPRHQMFGNPVPEQSDEMELEAQLVSNGISASSAEIFGDAKLRKLAHGADEWRLLLQVDTDDSLQMMWQDGGLLYFWIRESDARQGDFSKAWMFLQSG